MNWKEKKEMMKDQGIEKVKFELEIDLKEFVLIIGHKIE